MSQTLYSKRMGKEMARLDREEKRRRRAKEIVRADPQSRQTEEEEKMHGDTFDFVKTCGGLWG